jgi:hypothetical protein
MACPVCSGHKKETEVLVCGSCWWTVPATDRVAFGNIYRRDKKAAVTKGQKIIRDLIDRRSEG